jgi:hypothetical protein
MGELFWDNTQRLIGWLAIFANLLHFLRLKRSNRTKHKNDEVGCEAGHQPAEES